MKYTYKNISTIMMGVYVYTMNKRKNNGYHRISCIENKNAFTFYKYGRLNCSKCIGIDHKNIKR